jgi:tetraacyldisaccharide 4'-kinase
MVDNPLLKILLAPFALLYGIMVGLRNWFYQKNLLKSFDFDIPVISVGNLSVGGAGKTPHTEYLIRILKDYIDVATLSRGYGRKTKGFLIVHSRNNADQVGDEPLQFSRKFPDIVVAVGESRAFAISELLMHYPKTQAVLLDDAFQHRAVRPGLNILLTEYDRPFTRDHLMPVGRLREWRSGYRRADIIVVTKCPEVVSEEEKNGLIQAINPLPEQKVFFSKYSYQNPYFLFKPSYRIALDEELDVLLICAIARTDYLLEFVEPRVGAVRLLEYEDHHKFSKFDLSNLSSRFKRMDSRKKIILTTEKDAMRLELHRAWLMENQLPVFVLPVEVNFLFGEKRAFDQAVQNFLLEFKV